jgi:hypothetical protein
MKTLDILDSEVVTLTDYPIHDLKGEDRVIIKLYFRIFQKGCSDIIPRVAVIDKSLVVPAFDEDVRKEFAKFEKANPHVKYFALDGNHRTTAASLTHSPIPALVFETDKDCKDAQKLFELGEIFRPYEANSIDEYIQEMKDHFSHADHFFTVADKTKMMVEDVTIELPKYMVDIFCGRGRSDGAY